MPESKQRLINVIVFPSGCFSFRHVALSRNQSASNGSTVKTQSQISEFLTEVKIRKEVGEMSQSVFRATPGSNH